MYQTILLPVDTNAPESQTKACETAVKLAQSFGAKLRVLEVVPDFGMPIVGAYFPENFEQKMLSDGKARLDAFADKTFPADLVAQRIIGQGSIHKVILEQAKACGADLIVMASHRPEVQDYLIGPNAAQVMRHATCSVMVVRD